MAKKIKAEEIVQTNIAELTLPDNSVRVQVGDSEILVTRTLPLFEMIRFVNEVVVSCVDAEACEYTPESYDFAIRAGVISHYAHLPLPDKIEERYDAVYRSGVYEQIWEAIDHVQFDDILRTIDRKIRFMLDVMSSSAAMSIRAVMGEVEKMVSSVNAVFGGMDADAAKNVIRGISAVENATEEDAAWLILGGFTGKDSGGDGK